VYTIDSNNVASILGIVHANEKIGKQKENLSFYNQLLIRDSANAISYRKQMATILEKNMFLNDALIQYQNIFQQNKKDWETALHLCDILLQLDVVEKADSIINIALKANADICALQYKKGGIAYLLGKNDTSIFYIKKAFSCGDTLPAYFKTIGLAYLDTENYDSTLHYLNKYLKISDQDEKSYSSIGMVYSQKEKLDSAISYYNRACAVGISYNYIFNCKALAYLLEEKQQYEKALIIYYKIYYISYDKEAIYKIASIEDKRKNYQTALVWYKKYLDSKDDRYKNASMNRKRAITEILSKQSLSTKYNLND